MEGRSFLILAPFCHSDGWQLLPAENWKQLVMVSEVKNFEFVNHVQMAQEEKIFLFKTFFRLSLALEE